MIVYALDAKRKEMVFIYMKLIFFCGIKIFFIFILFYFKLIFLNYFNNIKNIFKNYFNIFSIKKLYCRRKNSASVFGIAVAVVVVV
jgi:hypothetical protein